MADETLPNLVGRVLRDAPFAMRQLAADSGLSYDVLRSWRSGRRRPSRGSAQRLAAGLEQRGQQLLQLAKELREAETRASGSGSGTGPAPASPSGSAGSLSQSGAAPSEADTARNTGGLGGQTGGSKAERGMNTDTSQDRAAAGSGGAAGAPVQSNEGAPGRSAPGGPTQRDGSVFGSSTRSYGGSTAGGAGRTSDPASGGTSRGAA